MDVKLSIDNYTSDVHAPGIYRTDLATKSTVSNKQEDTNLPTSHEIMSKTGEASILDLESLSESVTTNIEADAIPKSLGNQTEIASTTTCSGHDLNTAKPARKETQDHSSIDPPLERYKVSPDRGHVKLHSIPCKSALAKRVSEARTSMPPLGLSEVIPAESALRLSAMSLPKAVVSEIGGGKENHHPQLQSSFMAAPEPFLTPLNTPPSFDLPSRQQIPLTSKRSRNVSGFVSPDSELTSPRGGTETPKRRRKDLEDFRARVAEKRLIKEDASRRRQEEEQRLEQRMASPILISSSRSSQTPARS